MMEGHTEIPLNPTAREVRFFGLGLVAFAAICGGLAGWKPSALVVASTVLFTATIVSIAIHHRQWKAQSFGLLLPAVLFAMAAPALLMGVPSIQAAAMVWSCGLALAVAVIFFEGFGKQVYVGWIRSAQPAGWTISAALFSLIYYGLLTPVGVVMKLAGRDPLERHFDASAASYWKERQPSDDPDRYFRQF